MKLRSYSEAYRDIVGDKNEMEAESSDLWAAKEIAARSLWCKQNGWTILQWTPYTKGSPLTQHIEQYYKTWATGVSYPTFDHPYVLRNKEKGIRKFCIEPYDIDEEGLVWLTALVKDGWQVEINQRTIHYPGRTMRIAISRPTPQAT